MRTEPFNPVKQAFDYDKNGTYVNMWVPEVRKLEKLENGLPGLDNGRGRGQGEGAVWVHHGHGSHQED